MAELWQLGALELAEAIRKGETSSREVLDAHRARVDAVNGHLNAIVVRLDDEATAAAEAADRAVADGAELGPLHGVPFTVKENIDVAGYASTSGVVALAQAYATRDAPVVERLRAAGAIPFARTNLPDFGLRMHTDSSLHGRTRNPWHPDRTAGGSSGGEAAALASGMSPLGLGNDIAGSLRNPAHYCGIASIKPSTGLVPHASSLPPDEATIMFQLMLAQGVLARRVADVRAGLLAVAGPHVRDPLALPVTLPQPPSGGRLRVAVTADPPGCGVDPRIVAAIRAAADALADAGHVVEEATPQGYAQTFDLWGELLMGDVQALRADMDALLGEKGRKILANIYATFPEHDVVGLVGAHLRRSGIERRWHEFLSEWDVLLTPTAPTLSVGHDADVASKAGADAALAHLRPLLPANVFGLPAAVAPCGLADGMPVGAQFTARRFNDLTALAAAQAVEEIFGVLTPIEPVLG